MNYTKGKLFSGDFLENTMTFEIDGDFTLKYGNYIIIREEDYKAPEMYEALKEELKQLKVDLNIADKSKIRQLGKLVNLETRINRIESLLKEIENES